MSKHAPGTLSPRQLDILHGYCEGLAAKEIARQLGMSTGTVKYQGSAVLRELGVKNRTQAVVRAIQQGLIPLE